MIVRLAVHFLVFNLKTEQTPFFPITETKIKMAKSIVRCFPCLGGSTSTGSTLAQPGPSSTTTRSTLAQSDDGSTPTASTLAQSYDLYFHPKTGGFIETRLKMLRDCHLKPSERKRKSGLKDTTLGEGSGAGPSKKRAKVPPGHIPLEKLQHVDNIQVIEYEVSLL